MPASFVFDANRCTGCGACRVACTIENGLAPDVSWRRIETFNPQRRPTAPVFHVSLACNHCATAACMHACPADAYRRDGVTGAVLLNSDLCIGCGYCSWACPYDAPVFDETAGVMTKCTWCTDRLRAGLKPACVSHCPTGALGYADVAPSSRVMVMTGIPATTLQPSLHVIPLAPGRTQPMMADAGPDVLLAPPSESPRGITLRTEWPLAIFTLGIAVLVGLITATAAEELSFAPSLFIPSATVVMAIAGAHLGRKDRGYRAILNVRRSWLSREIVAVSLFVAMASAWLIFAPSTAAFGWIAALVGFAGLFCADSVYGVLPGGPGYRHSASVLLTGALVAAAAGASVIAAVPLVALKAWMFLGEERRLPPLASALRAALGFAAPVLFLGFAGNPMAALACVLAGEAIGRAEYYMQLTKRSPRREMDAVLAA